MGDRGSQEIAAPDGLREMIMAARGILIALHDRVPADLEEWLAERPNPGSVEILCQRFPDSVYLLELLRRGHLLFDACVPPATRIILDDERGYVLPEWKPIGNPKVAASGLRWGKMGSYLCVRGAVTEIAAQGRFFKVMPDRRFWVWVVAPHGCPPPAVGSEVEVFGIASWVGGVKRIVRGLLLRNCAVPQPDSSEAQGD